VIAFLHARTITAEYLCAYLATNHVEYSDCKWYSSDATFSARCKYALASLLRGHRGICGDVVTIDKIFEQCIDNDLAYRVR